VPELVTSGGESTAEQTPLARMLFHAELRPDPQLRQEEADVQASTSAGGSGTMAAATETRSARVTPGDSNRWESAAVAASPALEERLADAAFAFFGPGVRIHVNVARGGSVEISLLLVALGALRLYRSHIENIQWFAGHARSIIRRLLLPPRPGQVVHVGVDSIVVPELPVDATADPSAATPHTAAAGPGPLQRLLPALAVAEGAILVGLLAALLSLYALD
jgi:hypothetical protein